MGTLLPDVVAEALFPRTRQAVLALLFGHPDERFYLRQITAIVGAGVGQVQRELERLARGGIIRRTREGRHVYFQANRDCAVYDELRGLVTKSLGVAPVLSATLKALADRILVAFVYGSVARGDERAASDLDLMVIGEVTFHEIASAVRQAESTLRREIHPTVYPAAEFRRTLAEGNHFLRSVMQSEKIFLIGDEDELGKLA